MLQRTDRSTVRTMCGVELKHLMLMLSLKETIDQLAMASSVLIFSCVEERG